ncbi:MAG: TRAP transporter small permease [Nevskiales bacterium]
MPKRLLGVLEQVESALLVLLLGSMVVLAGTQILLRNFFDLGLVWADPLLRAMVLWAALLGGLAAARGGNRHITVDVIAHFLPPRGKAAAGLIAAAFTAALCAMLAWVSLQFVLGEYGSGVTISGLLPVWLSAAAMPLAFALMSLRFALLSLTHLAALRAGASAEPPA